MTGKGPPHVQDTRTAFEPQVFANWFSYLPETRFHFVFVFWSKRRPAFRQHTEQNQTQTSLCCESLRKVVFEPRVGAAWLHMMGHTGPDKLLIAKARNRLWRRGLQRIRAHTPTRNAKVCHKTRGGEAPSPHHQTPKPDCSEDPCDARGLWGIVAPM